MRLVAASLAALVLGVTATTARADPVSVAFVTFLGGPGAQLTSAAPAGDVNGDRHGDVIIGVAPAQGRDRGIAYVVYGPFAPGETIQPAQLGRRGFVMREDGHHAVRGTVSGAGDFNGDGFDDVLVGAPDDPELSTRAYVVFGRRHPQDVDLRSLGSRGVTLLGKRSTSGIQDHFGNGLVPLGDVNRDGLADVGVLASGDSIPDAYEPGSADVIFGRRSGGSISMAKLGRAGVRIDAAYGLQQIRAAGDWNADGRPDLVLGGSTPAGSRVWIVYGRGRPGRIALRRLGGDGVVIRIRAAADEGLVEGLAAGADVDGDHRPDVVIGLPFTHPDTLSGHPGGGVWVIRGSRTPTDVDLTRPGSRAWEIARGDPLPYPGGTGYAGSAVGFAQLNGDRRADVVTVVSGGLAVVYGTSSRTTRRLSALGPAEGFLIGVSDFGGVSGLAVADDLSGDGHPDLLAVSPAMPHPEPGMGFSRPEVYLILLP